MSAKLNLSGTIIPASGSNTQAAPSVDDSEIYDFAVVSGISVYEKGHELSMGTTMYFSDPAFVGGERGFVHMLMHRPADSVREADGSNAKGCIVIDAQKNLGKAYLGVSVLCSLYRDLRTNKDGSTMLLEKELVFSVLETEVKRIAGVVTVDNMAVNFDEGKLKGIAYLKETIREGEIWGVIKRMGKALVYEGIAKSGRQSSYYSLLRMIAQGYDVMVINLTVWQHAHKANYGKGAKGKQMDMVRNGKYYYAQAYVQSCIATATSDNPALEYFGKVEASRQTKAINSASAELAEKVKEAGGVTKDQGKSIAALTLTVNPLWVEIDPDFHKAMRAVGVISENNTIDLGKIKGVLSLRRRSSTNREIGKVVVVSTDPSVATTVAELLPESRPESYTYSVVAYAAA
jgi:hypothetical protein